MVDAGARGFEDWLEGIAAYAGESMALRGAALTAGTSLRRMSTWMWVYQLPLATECLLVGRRIDRVALHGSGADRHRVSGGGR